MPRLFSASTCALAVLVISGLAVPTAQAQFGSELALSGVSYRTYYTQGEATMQIFVISSVGGTAIYEIGTDTRLMELAALAGFSPPVRNDRTVTRSTLTIIRPRLANETIYSARIEDLVREPERHPTLEEGDVILIDTVQKTRFTWREGVSIISGVTSVLLLAGRLGLINFRRN